MYQSVGRIRTRGGRGRGFVSTGYYNWNSRSDQNFFETLSDLPQDGGHAIDIGEKDLVVDSDGFTLVRKRQRVNTGGGSNEQAKVDDIGPDPDEMSNFENMTQDQKLSAMFATLTSNRNSIRNVEKRMDTIEGINSRMSQVETVIRSHSDRLKLLEYKSIDIEARSRRNNLLFKGLAEERDEDCRRKVLNFLEDNLHMDELPTIERVHRLGRYNAHKGPRPIIAAFSYYRDTEEIMSNARSLRNTSYGISRDHPPEITKARQVLWPQYKAAKSVPFNKASIGYPAKLIVNGSVVSDMFPDWDLIMRGSRVSTPKQSNNVTFSGTSINPTQSALVNQGNGSATEINPNTVTPGQSINSQTAHSNSALHEHMDFETQDPRVTVSSPTSPTSPSLLSGEIQRGPCSWNAPSRFTVTPVPDPQFNKDFPALNDSQRHVGPRISSELTASPRSLADKLIRASKLESVVGGHQGSDRASRPATSGSNGPPSRSSSENRRATGARQLNLGHGSNDNK